MLCTVNLSLALVLVFVCTVVADVYLKPSVRSIMVLEGEELTINWIAYDENERTPPCHWDYASNDTDSGFTFMAYDTMGERHEFGKKEPWQFTKTQEPCKGGIRKLAKQKDSGVYMMLLDTGYKRKREDSQTNVKVYNAGDLTLSVSVNGEVYHYTLSGGTHINLPVLETNKPVNISVVLSNTFPPTMVNITRDTGAVQCDHTYKTCSSIIDLQTATGAPIVIRLWTGITGADPVIISQPVIYSVSDSNTARNWAIAFGILFFITLIIIIVIITCLIITRRRIRKMTEYEHGEEKKQKASLIQRVRSGPQKAASDLMTAFNVKKQVSQHGAGTENERKALESTIRKYEEDYKEKEIHVRNKLERAMKEVKDLNRKCEKNIDEAQHDHGDISKAELLQQLETSLKWIENDLGRCDSNLKDDNNMLSSSGLLRETKATPDERENLLPETYTKNHEVMIMGMLTNLDKIGEIIQDLGKRVKDIQQKLDSIKK